MRLLLPQLFVELNELIVEKDHEMRWKERARWIKFEEDVEEETDRWGKPHVASLSFRSLLELRRTITHGDLRLPEEDQNDATFTRQKVTVWKASLCPNFTLVLPFLCCCPAGAILLDLEQNSLPGIAHLVVETMIISDQIRAEDRPSVLRALLLKHRSDHSAQTPSPCHVWPNANIVDHCAIVFRSLNNKLLSSSSSCGGGVIH